METDKKNVFKSQILSQPQIEGTHISQGLKDEIAYRKVRLNMQSSLVFLLDPDYIAENDIILCKCPFTSKPRMRACVIFYSVQGKAFSRLKSSQTRQNGQDRDLRPLDQWKHDSAVFSSSSDAVCTALRNAAWAEAVLEPGLENSQKYEKPNFGKFLHCKQALIDG